MVVKHFDVNFLSRTEEDYLESIYKISLKNNFIRVKDISNDLKVKPPSVTDMAKKLYKKKFIVYEKNAPIILTDEGKKIGKIIYNRHATFKKLLQIIMIPDEIAKKDACEIEHHLHPETLEQFEKFIAFLEESFINPNFKSNFNHFCKTGKLLFTCKEKDFINK